MMSDGKPQTLDDAECDNGMVDPIAEGAMLDSGIPDIVHLSGKQE